MAGSVRSGRWAAALAAVLAILVSGCAPSPRSDQARDAALAFVRAEPGSACALLAPATRDEVERAGSCAEQLASAGLGSSSEVERVALAGNSAQVVLGDQVLFLALFDDGWLVTAAGCSRTSDDPAEPYDCPVKGD